MLKATTEFPLTRILSSKKFVWLYSLATLHFFYGYFFTSVYKQYGKDYINDDRFLSIVGATSSLFNGVFKFVWGTLLDYYDFRKVYGLIISLEILMIFSVQVSVYNKWAFMAVSWMTYMCDGCMTAMLPALCLSQFGLIRGP